MAVLKNKTQSNFTMISNNILRDKELSMKDRGVLCTICSLPDGWEFSISGLSATVPDGRDSIRNSIFKLESLGYLIRTKKRGTNGQYLSEIEVFAERRTMTDFPSRQTRHGKTDTDGPLRADRDGDTVTDNPAQYNTENQINEINTDNKISIDQSEKARETDGSTDTVKYKELIAENIKLDWLMQKAEQHGPSEVSMVGEIYDVICDMVCYPRESVVIKNITYPWGTVRERFLKLRYQHIADVLNRIVDASLNIKNMSKYLISTLYTASLTGTLEAEAGIHDDYLRRMRGNPYD